MYGSRGTPRKSRSNPGGASGSRLASDITSKGGESFSITVDTEESDGNRLRINYSHLKTLLATFAQYKSTPIKDLSPDLNKQLHLVGKIFNYSRNSDFYPNLIESVKTHFGDMKSAVPGTVGGFFHGCFLPSAYAGAPHCSAECSGSIQPPDVAGWQTCGHNVALLMADGSLEMQHQVRDSNHLVLHVLGADFKGLTPAQVGDLRRAGIARVDIDLVLPDSKYTTVSEGVRLEDVPLVGGSSASSRNADSESSFASASSGLQDGGHWDSSHSEKPHRGGSSHRPPPPRDDGWNLGGVLLAVIFIIIIVAVIVVLFAIFRRRPSNDYSKSADPVGSAASSEAADPVSGGYWGN